MPRRRAGDTLVHRRADDDDTVFHHPELLGPRRRRTPRQPSLPVPVTSMTSASEVSTVPG